MKKTVNCDETITAHRILLLHPSYPHVYMTIQKKHCAAYHLTTRQSWALNLSMVSSGLSVRMSDVPHMSAWV